MNSLPVELVNMIIQTNLIELNELEQREELLNYNLINANFNFLTNSILFSNLLINSNQSLTSLMNILSCPIRYSFYPVYSIKFSSTLSLTTDFWDDHWRLATLIKQTSTELTSLYFNHLGINFKHLLGATNLERLSLTSSTTSESWRHSPPILFPHLTQLNLHTVTFPTYTSIESLLSIKSLPHLLHLAIAYNTSGAARTFLLPDVHFRSNNLIIIIQSGLNLQLESLAIPYIESIDLAHSFPNLIYLHLTLSSAWLDPYLLPLSISHLTLDCSKSLPYLLAGFIDTLTKAHAAETTLLASSLAISPSLSSAVFPHTSSATASPFSSPSPFSSSSSSSNSPFTSRSSTSTPPLSPPQRFLPHLRSIHLTGSQLLPEILSSRVVQQLLIQLRTLGEKRGFVVERIQPLHVSTRETVEQRMKEREEQEQKRVERSEFFDRAVKIGREEKRWRRNEGGWS